MTWAQPSSQLSANQKKAPQLAAFNSFGLKRLFGRGADKLLTYGDGFLFYFINKDIFFLQNTNSYKKHHNNNRFEVLLLLLLMSWYIGIKRPNTDETGIRLMK